MSSLAFVRSCTNFKQNFFFTFPTGRKKPDLEIACRVFLGWVVTFFAHGKLIVDVLSPGEKL